MDEDLALEILDEDLPGVVSATYDTDKSILGKFAREYVETDSIAGLRSTFLCSYQQSLDVPGGTVLTIENQNFEIEVRQKEGVYFSRFILSV
jgi:hypothetical protein